MQCLPIPLGLGGGSPLLSTGWQLAAFSGCLSYVLASSPSSQSVARGQLHLAQSHVLRLQLLGVDTSQDKEPGDLSQDETAPPLQVLVGQVMFLEGFLSISVSFMSEMSSAFPL